jgi:hypothetical protein
MLGAWQLRADVQATVWAGVDAETAMSVEERLDEPHERSPTSGYGLRAATGRLDRANRDVSEEEA